MQTQGLRGNAVYSQRGPRVNVALACVLGATALEVRQPDHAGHLLVHHKDSSQHFWKHWRCDRHCVQTLCRDKLT